MAKENQEKEKWQKKSHENFMPSRATSSGECDVIVTCNWALNWHENWHNFAACFMASSWLSSAVAVHCTKAPYWVNTFMPYTPQPQPDYPLPTVPDTANWFSKFKIRAIKKNCARKYLQHVLNLLQISAMFTAKSSPWKKSDERRKFSFRAFSPFRGLGEIESVETT